MQLLTKTDLKSCKFLSRVENAGQSSSGTKEPKPKDSESEAIKSNVLVKGGRDNEKTNTDIRNKVFTYSNFFLHFVKKYMKTS